MAEGHRQVLEAPQVQAHRPGCCPTLSPCGSCDELDFVYRMPFPTVVALPAGGQQTVPVEVTMRFRLERCSGPLTLGDILYIQVIQDRTAERRTLDAILRVLLFGGAVVVLVAVAFGAVYARRALVPIREPLSWGG